MDDVESQEIGEIEKYANAYIPEQTSTFTHDVEQFATSELPPGFDHLRLDFVSPLADDALQRVRERLGDDASNITFIDLQHILHNEITDLEDQQMQFTDKARERCEATVKRLQFTEESTLKLLSNETLDPYDSKAINWYLSRNIDRWNKKTDGKDGEADKNSIQNEKYFAMLYEKFNGRTHSLASQLNMDSKDIHGADNHS